MRFLNLFDVPVSEDAQKLHQTDDAINYVVMNGYKAITLAFISCRNKLRTTTEAVTFRSHRNFLAENAVSYTCMVCYGRYHNDSLCSA